MPEVSSSSCSYPFNPIPFEAFRDGSWHGVLFISIEDGNLSVEISNPEKIKLGKLRARSRRATLLDCTNFLRRGIHICALLPNPAVSSGSSQIQCRSPAWIDAKIIKVQRNHHHDDECKCEFLVIPCKNLRNPKTKREMKVININQISILQTIIHEPDENGTFSMSSTENSNSLPKSKHKNERFLSEIISLMVLSSLHGVNTEIKAVQNKIVYHVINYDVAEPSSSSVQNMKVVCFKESNGVSKPRIETISVPSDLVETRDLWGTNEENLVNLNNESLYKQMNIRRSNRRKSKPDSFYNNYSSPKNCPISAKVNTVKKKPILKKTKVGGNKNKSQKFVLKRNKENEKDTYEAGKKRGAKRKRNLINEEYDKVIEELMGGIKDYAQKKANLDGSKNESGVCEPGPSNYSENEDFTWSSPHSDSEIKHPENDEYEDIYDQYNLCLTELALEEQKKKLDSNESIMDDAKDGDCDGSCEHECELDEQVGEICKLCHLVVTDIRETLPPFMEKSDHQISNERSGPISTNSLQTVPSSFTTLPSEISQPKLCENIWGSIPNLEPKLHPHQRNAFEFIWKNLAGTIDLENENPSSTKTGGCVISHSPGSGKTLTIISFLASYLSVYPQNRPLVLAPKGAVHTWQKEFEKWDIEIPVYIIHCRPSKRKNTIMDSLKMVKSWHENPSILLMTYPSFYSLAKEHAKDDYGKFMSNVLLNNPGLLILDEGHNPRSTKSKLRILLMKVKTELRILLSGTVYQNNFEEYFNTLCLARPRFVQDLINKLDSGKGVENTELEKNKVDREEKNARKLFVEKVGQMIKTKSGKEKKQGIDLLTELTFEFVDYFDGESLTSLPGLETYTIFVKSTKFQKKILNKLQNSIKPNTRYPIEIELLVSIGSIHPSLVQTSKCSRVFFTEKELEEMDKHATSFWSGSKTRFVIDVIMKSLVTKEKVLIFCHNLAPLHLLVKLIEIVFCWKEGEEILLLTGEQDLAVRSKTIDKFNGDKEGKRKILLVSTNACAEGINLTAASRVVLLDSEWNHSKTKQAIARAYRLGQEKVVRVYLLLASGTWEEGKYKSNNKKALMSKMVTTGKCVESERRRMVEEGEIADELLREIVAEDKKTIIEKVVKHR